ncbi:uncharacterized protein LOC116250439 [Nymphaea colorata]|uniref:uncharacterized protein LOC116250439 n=1 Tax=Nymphaea colorata TaxID=210225 RepID=UPI00129DD951|nr:uncharacterized protein LOC116250439 [Nymphaea colorata]
MESRVGMRAAVFVYLVALLAGTEARNMPTQVDKPQTIPGDFGGLGGNPLMGIGGGLPGFFNGVPGLGGSGLSIPPVLGLGGAPSLFNPPALGGGFPGMLNPPQLGPGGRPSMFNPPAFGSFPGFGGGPGFGGAIPHDLQPDLVKKSISSP